MSNPHLLVPVVLSEETLNAIMEMVSQVCQERGGEPWEEFERHTNGLIRQDIERAREQAGEDISGYNYYVYHEHTRARPWELADAKARGEGFPRRYPDRARSAESGLIDCPACAGEGQVFPGVNVNLWAGRLHWPEVLQAKICDLCQGSGEVHPETAADWQASGQ
jgi:hypothetical protein